MRVSDGYIDGFGRALDLYSWLFDKKVKMTYQGPMKDFSVMREDWKYVGEDIRKGIRVYENASRGYR